MINLLVDEWRVKLQAAIDAVRPFATLCRVPDLAVGSVDASVASDETKASVMVVTGSTRGRMIPNVRIDVSSCLPMDIVEARAVVLAEQNVIDVATIIYSKVRRYVIWAHEAPCDFCGESGKSMGSLCRHCNGTGKRTQPMEMSR